MSLLGLHHITIVASDAQRLVDFYTGVLGMRLIKQTVNFDDPGSYHLYFGNEQGAVGSAITFFEWPDSPKGKPGIGGTHHVALRVPSDDALLKWKRYLTDLGIKVRGPYNRTYFTSIYFSDPDGLIIEIATDGAGLAVDEPADALGQIEVMPQAERTLQGRDEDSIAALTWADPVPSITPDMALNHGMHHISAISSNIERTHWFLNKVLGLSLVKKTVNYDDPSSKHWYWSPDAGKPGTLLTYFERDPKQTRRVQMGIGQTHHYALAVGSDEEQLEWRERIIRAGIPVSPVRDRQYFKSIYMQDPDGHIVEIATVPPGFTVDETVESLGTALKLPPFVEPMRAQIEGSLKKLNVPEWKGLGV